MKVTLIGTGGIHTKDNSASVLIDNKILIDVPNGSEKNLMKLGKEIKNIDLILITHLHADHYFDVPFILAYNQVIKREKELYIVGPKKTKKIIMSVIHCAFSKYFDEYIQTHTKFVEFENNEEIKILDNYKIKTQKVDHGNIEAYGFIINNKLGITGDAKICLGVEKIIEDSEKIITDVSMIQGSEEHMGIDDVKQLLEKYKEKEIIATHMRNETKEELLKAEMERLIVPEDGYTFEV